jgi:peptidyl-prolyl cis-trans isomerase A (cyclophilin A)
MMKSITLLLVFLPAAVMLLAGCGGGERGQSNPEVLLRTELGDIRIEVFIDRAPITAANFMTYVDGNCFRGATFYRTVTMENQPDNDIRIEVIQGGLGEDPEGLGLPPISHETTEQTGVLHGDGTVSMARSAPGTASSEIFICIGDQPELDFGGKRNPDGQGFAAFGKVVEGMDIVRKIQARPAWGQMLDPPIKITGVARASD